LLEWARDGRVDWKEIEWDEEENGEPKKGQDARN